MIQGITEIDEVMSGNKRESLMKHIANQYSEIDKNYGLAYFIQDKYRCRECKSPLTLKQGRSGKSYLGCTKCSHTEY